MKAAVAGRLALAGTRADGLRIGLTTTASALTTLALLAATTVAAISPGDGPYTSELLDQGGLHPGIVIAFIGLCVPTLVLLAQCSRIGAPARDRRLSAIRLAGASPADVTRLVALESGLAAAVGALVGTGAFFVLRTTLDQPVAGQFTVYQATATGFESAFTRTGLRLPTDVLLPWWTYLAVAVAVPLLVAGMTVRALRHVAFTPFGVLRRTRTRVPRVLPLALIGAGVGLFFATAALLASGFAHRAGDAAVLGVLVLAFVLVVAGLLSGQGAMTALIGRSLGRRTSRPALLLAARRMTADPFAGTRAAAVLTVAVLIAAGARRLRDATLAGRNDVDGQQFFSGAYDLVDLVLVVVAVLAACGLLVAAAEGIVSRRRTYAAVVAAGTPRAVVGQAVLAELLLPLIPSLVLATVAGTAAAIGLFGWHGTDGTASVGIAWGPLLLTVIAAAAITALTTSLSLVFLRRATDVGELRSAA